MRFLASSARKIDILRFSPESRYLIAGDESHFDEWDLLTTEPAHGSGIGRPFMAIRFHPERGIAYAISEWHAMVLVHVRGRVINRSFICSRCSILDLSDNGRWLVVSGGFTDGKDGHQLRVFDTDCSEGWVSERWAESLETAPVLRWGVTWLPEADRFAISEWFGEQPNQKARITLRSGETGEIIQTRDRAGLPKDQLLAAPDGTLLAFSKATLSIWTGGDLSCEPRIVSNDAKKHFTDLAFHPSGRYLAATSNDATVKLYDTITWEVARTFTWDIGRMRSIAFSPDGTLAAAGSDKGKVVVWDVDL